MMRLSSDGLGRFSHSLVHSLARPLISLVMATTACLSAPCYADRGREGPQAQDPSEKVLAAAWEAAQERNDSDAYDKFLTQHPDSRHQAEAVAALQRARKKEAAFLAQPYNGFGRPEALKALRSVEGGSGLRDFALGTRLLGPGIVVGGSFSARQHILVPYGEWIPVASLNHEISTFSTLRLTSLAFGKFSGAEILELMFVTFPRESAGSQLQSSGVTAAPIWPAADQCRASKDFSDYHLLDSDMRHRWCSLIASKGVSVDAMEPRALLGRVRAALSMLDVGLPNFVHRAETHVTSPSGQFISYATYYRAADTRITLVPVIDESDVTLAPELDSATRWAYLQQAHLAYHTAIAFGKYYGPLVLQSETRLKSQDVVRVLGRAQ